MTVEFMTRGEQLNARATHKEIIKNDAIPAPDWRIADSIPDLGFDPVSATRYSSHEIFQ